ncbi:MAG: hypothetical protein PHR89_04855, partial [Bacilli bacterium]|nr:hypothetical protein [Bacilli bacterium]
MQAEGLRAASNEQSSFGLIRDLLFHVSTPSQLLFNTIHDEIACSRKSKIWSQVYRLTQLRAST